MIKSLLKKIVVVVNGSESSIIAAQYAVVLAKAYRCSVKAVYVVDIATLKQLQLRKFFEQEESIEFENSLKNDGERYLKYIEELGIAKGVPIDTELRKGAVWAEVTAVADAEHADLILLGCTEKPDVDKRDVISSSYRKIMSNAHCSVLIVKEENIEKLYKMA